MAVEDARVSAQLVPIVWVTAWVGLEARRGNAASNGWVEDAGAVEAPQDAEDFAVCRQWVVAD